MTIASALAALEVLRPGNTYTTAQKVGWLSKLDGRIFREIILTHEDYEGAMFTGDTTATETTTALFVLAPYDEDVYVNFLEAQVDREDGEDSRYNQSISLFNAAMRDFAGYYNRTHMPVSQTVPYFRFGAGSAADDDTVTFTLIDPTS